MCMSLVCTSEYLSVCTCATTISVFWSVSPLDTELLKNLPFILFKPNGGSVFPFIHKPLRQFNLFAHFSCNLIYTDMYILLSMLSESRLLMFHYGDLDVIKKLIAMATLPGWLCQRSLPEHFYSSLRPDISKPRLMLPFRFRDHFPL